MLGFNVLPGILLLSCILAVYAAPTELSPKEEVSADEPTQDVLERKATVPTNMTLVNGTLVARAETPKVSSPDLTASIQSVLTGYDIVIGDPINVINSGTTRDTGIKGQIFKYDTSNNDVERSVQTGCSSTADSTVIDTVGKFRKQLDSEVEVAGSIGGSGWGVSAEVGFSVSRSSSEIEDHMTKNKGSLTMFTMTCTLRHLSVGSADSSLPVFTKRFANFLTRTLGKIRNADTEKTKKAAFKRLLQRYGTHYISESTIGARVTTTNFLSQSLTSTMTQGKIKACASASAKVDYMGLASAELSASGCSAEDKSKFDSKDNGVTKTVKNSYGTTKVAGDGSKFSMEQMKEPRPIWIKLSPILDLFRPEALRYGIPAKFGDVNDTDGTKREAFAGKLLLWLEPLFAEGKFENNYCEQFGDKYPDCGKEVRAATKKGCGYTGSCGLHKKCEDIDTVPYYKCTWINPADQFIGKTIEISISMMVRLDDTPSCYLFWREASGNRKNAEFRCNKSKGDRFWIKRSGEEGNNYLIGYDNCPLYWRELQNSRTRTTNNRKTTLSTDGYGDEIRREWCADHVDHKGICDGSKHDCLKKGKGKCNNDPMCYGVMFHGGWAADLKGVKLCTSSKMVEKGDWMTYLKDSSDAEFRCGDGGDKFWVKEQPDGKWAIGYDTSSQQCPMYWRDSATDTKNAEFRCGKYIEDDFWIKEVMM